MKGTILSSVISASAVAAQLSIAPELFQAAAVNINDPEYTTCSVVADYVGECVTAIGGTDALATADPTALLSCACCVSATPVYPLYSACSSYLSDEGGATYRDSYSAYSVLYSACDAAALCTEGSDNTAAVTATATSESESESESETASGTITSAATQTYATACEDMVGIFASCSNKIDDFTELPFKEQASCYCCRTRGGTLSWTDAMDKYAKTCASWAKTGEPETAYSVAQTFASFCDRFSDVCESGTVAANSASATDSSAETTADSTKTGNPNTEPVTVTIPASETATSADSDGAAGSLRVGVCGTLLAAALAVAMVL
ncbi:hypothetical protein B0T10DRAFT_323562 [Thelonectria olida]|uniref:Uncharacterized protein n=1 Tax=Thelonectria olida TaxID=1576542 RepID=A0A9P9AMQ9_9HYPO|nr:hypothetical protein B0T10DRAFT_323562 [Thelonectria olida]